MYDRVTVERLQQLVSESTSYTEVVRKLGRKPIGSNISSISFRCKKWNIDTSHFLGKQHARGKPSSKKRQTHERLVLGNPRDGRTSPKILTRCMLELGFERKCQVCGLTEWNELPLTLDVDHIDGRYWNNQISNLRFICPNCHRQTDTYGNKNRAQLRQLVVRTD